MSTLTPILMRPRASASVMVIFIGDVTRWSAVNLRLPIWTWQRSWCGSHFLKTQHWWYHESQRFTIKWSLAKQRVKVCQNFQSPGTQSRQGMELGLHQVPGMDVSEKARSGFGLWPSTGWRRTSRSYDLFFHSWSVQSLFKSHFCKEFFQGCQNISWQLLKQNKKKYSTTNEKTWT